MENNSKIERIEQYLNNELSETEQMAFDNELQTDESLATEFERRQTAHKALDFVITKNLKAQLEELEQESKVVYLQKRRKTRFFLLSSAASMLLAVGFFAFYLMAGNSSSTELVSKYYGTPDYNFQRTTEAVDSEDILKKGVTALENKEYTNAISTLASIQKSDEDYLIAQYFLAHARYFSNQYDQAEEGFKLVVAGDDLRYKEAAEWYALLSCLAQEKDCSADLTNLANNNNNKYQIKAQEIKKQLK